MLVDVHAHIGVLTPDAPRPVRVAMYAGSCGLQLVLVSNRDAAPQPRPAANRDETDANLACLEACRMHPRLVALYSVRPGALDSHVHALAGALSSEPFRGVAFCPEENGFEADSPVLDDYLRVLSAGQWPAVFCVTADERAAPTRIYSLARRHPTVPILLCPCGTGRSQRSAALDAVAHARRQENADLYLDTSHADAEGVRLAVRTLGAQHVLFGSDALSYGDAHLPRHIALLDELRKTMPANDLKLVAGGTGVRLFPACPQQACSPVAGRAVAHSRRVCAIDR